jgi:hypothetical protein
MFRALSLAFGILCSVTSSPSPGNGSISNDASFHPDIADCQSAGELLGYNAVFCGRIVAKLVRNAGANNVVILAWRTRAASRSEWP